MAHIKSCQNHYGCQLMTLCKYECMILSHDSSKILTACRLLKISIAHRQMKAKIHSFPTMYILGGVRCGRNGSNQGFRPRIRPKNIYFSGTKSWSSDFGGVWDPQILKCCHFRHYPSKFWWISVKMSYGHVWYLQNCPNAGLLHFFQRAAHKKLKKRVLLAFWPITPMHPGYVIGKLTSRAFWKCGSVCWYNFLNPSYG